MAKIKVWVLSTCIPEENEPCLPTVYGSQAAADAGFDEMMRAEWEANKPEDEETCEALPYPGNPVAAHEILANNPHWGRWEITASQIEIDKQQPLESTGGRQMMHWTEADQQQALGEGWLIADNSDHGMRIERYDAGKRFDCDAAAVAFVGMRASLGNKLAQHAFAELAWHHAVDDAAAYE